MAKSSKIAKNERRKAVTAHFAVRRAELKDVLRRPSSTAKEKAAARRELDRRTRGYLRAFGLSRVNLRAHAHAGPARSAQVQLVTPADTPAA
jgi:small subunit ribosomal protein S14